MNEAEAIRCAKEAYLRGVPFVGCTFVANGCERVRETWIVEWNVHREDGTIVRDGGFKTLVSDGGRTRHVDPAGSLADAVVDFETDHEPVPGEENLPEGWNLERIKDLGFVSPVLVTRPVTVMEYGVDDLFEVSPKAIVDLGGLCLVLCSKWGDWHMGQWDDEHTIACWASYGSDLGEAIKAL